MYFLLSIYTSRKQGLLMLYEEFSDLSSFPQRGKDCPPKAGHLDYPYKAKMAIPFLHYKVEELRPLYDVMGMT